MSTPYQIMFNQTPQNNVEQQLRFYKKRNIEGKPQYDSNFYIFQESMNSRLKAMGIILAIFICIKIYYYEIIIMTSIDMRLICE